MHSLTPVNKHNLQWEYWLLVQLFNNTMYIVAFIIKMIYWLINLFFISLQELSYKFSIIFVFNQDFLNIKKVCTLPIINAIDFLIPSLVLHVFLWLVPCKYVIEHSDTLHIKLDNFVGLWLLSCLWINFFWDCLYHIL